MSRYVLRFTGNGLPTAEEIDRIATHPSTHILDSSPRMLLIEVPDETLKHLASILADWTISPERHYGVPDPRPVPRS